MSQLERLPQAETKGIQKWLSDDLLSSPTRFDLRSLHRRGWVAAPVQDEISDEEAIWIAAAAADLGESTAVCVTTEAKSESYIEAYEVELSDEGLHRFHYNCMLRAFLLAPRSLSFAIL